MALVAILRNEDFLKDALEDHKGHPYIKRLTYFFLKKIY
jgi:hypothetical protein